MNDKEFMNKLDNEFSQFTGKVMDLAYKKLYPKPTKFSIFADGIWTFSDNSKTYRYVQHIDGQRVIQKGTAAQVIQDVFIPKENGMKTLQEIYNTYKAIEQKYEKIGKEAEELNSDINMWIVDTEKCYDITIQLLKDEPNKRERIHLYHDGFYLDMMTCAEEEMCYESPASGSDLFIAAEELCNIRGESEAIDYELYFKKIGEYYKKEILPSIIKEHSNEWLQSNIDHIDELLNDTEMRNIWTKYNNIHYREQSESQYHEYVCNKVDAINTYLEHFEITWYNQHKIEYLDKILKYLKTLLIKEQKERNNEKGDENMNCNQKLISKILNDKVIPEWEERGMIGANKTFDENADHLNDILLDYVGDWWDETLKEITTKYMEMAKQKEPTREQMINTIIELCEKDLDIKERVAEWIIYETHPKYTDKYIYVNRIQNNDSDIKIEDILLYVITDGGNDLITMKKWWSYQIPEGENEEYTTEQIKSLYNKIK